MNQKDEVVTGPFTDENFASLVALGNITYGGREISDPEYLEWEYLQNPDGKAVIFTATSNENVQQDPYMDSTRVVAQYIVLPRQYSIHGEVVRGSLSVNSLTHPHFRRHGLFSKLALDTFNRCRDQNILFTIGFPNSVSSPLIDRQNLFATFGSLPLMLLPLNPVRSFIRYIRNRNDKTGDEIEIKIPFDNSFPTISRFDFENDREPYSKLLKAFNASGRNTTHRSFEYLRWRYCLIPRRSYTIVKNVNENGIEIIAVLRFRYLFGLRSCILTDLIGRGEELPLTDMIRFIKNVAKKNGLDLLVTTVPIHSEEYAVLKRCGFFRISDKLLPQKLNVIFRQHGLVANADDFKNWFLTFGDYDIF
jgi:hypothetical protein